MKRFALFVSCALAVIFLVQCEKNPPQEVEIKKVKKEEVDKYELPNQARCFRSGKVFIAGRMNDAAVDDLQGQGAKTIVNLMAAGEMQWDEEKYTGEKGLKYFHIPVDAKDREYKNVPQMLEIFGNEQNYPIVVHCSGANRAAAVWAIAQVEGKKLTAEEALAKLQEMGTAAGAVSYFKGYVDKTKNDSGE